jgi:hypothetical protein
MKHISAEKLELIKKANDKVFSKKIQKIQNVVFVYTPIKVGSTTLVSSIRLSGCNKFIVAHLHDEIGLYVLTGVKDVTIDEIIHYNESIGKKVFVIDVYRSPIERKISDFFEHIELHFNNSQENVNKYPIERLIKRFDSLFPYIARTDYTMDKYNIVLPEKFDYNKKYAMIEENNIHYIKLRLKDSNEWGNILTFLLGNEICIVTDYETENKPINDLYKKFKQEYRLPVNYLEIIKKCKYFQYYYSPEEKLEYLNSWDKKLTKQKEHFKENEYRLYEKISVENMNYNSIQFEHYIDNGCLCPLCSTKRAEILKKHKAGEKITDKIKHNELVSKALTARNEKMQKLIQATTNTRGNKEPIAVTIHKRFQKSFSVKFW